MKGAAKLVLLIVAVLVLEASVMGAVVAGLIIRHTAFVPIDIRDRHSHFRGTVPFPMLAHSHFRLGGSRCPLVDARQLNAALNELQNAPDSTLVETRKGTEHVVIRKVGTDFQIDVTQPGEEVHVTLPVSVVRIFSSGS